MDRISLLPDELLAYILSFLPVKEAMLTNIVSPRWRYLWTFASKLDFDRTDLLLKVKQVEKFGPAIQEKSLDMEQRRYMRWVNHCLATLNSNTIEEFRVFFNLSKIHKTFISKWLTYALAKKVESLELNLTNGGCLRKREYEECYSFPYQLLHDPMNFKQMKKISMNYVNVNGEALEFFLGNCPLLEHLSVSESGQLLSLRVTGPLPSFKCLEISSCNNLNSVEIRGATNLVYLKYSGSRIHFVLENVPRLVEACFGGKLTKKMEDVLLLFSSYLSQLEILRIDKYDSFSMTDTGMFCSATNLINLKQLIVRVYVSNDHNLLVVTNLIQASPRLKKFVLEAFPNVEYVTPNWDFKKIGGSYPCLKKIELLGYCGGNSELEFIMHFLENAVALEKIIIDPSKPCEPCDYKNKYRDEEKIGSSRARQLTEKVPPKINLEILEPQEQATLEDPYDPLYFIHSFCQQ